MFEAKFPSPTNSSGFMVATTMKSGRSRPAAASAAWAASAMRSPRGSLRRPTRVIPAPAIQTFGMDVAHPAGRRPKGQLWSGGPADARRGTPTVVTGRPRRRPPGRIRRRRRGRVQTVLALRVKRACDRRRRVDTVVASRVKRGGNGGAFLAPPLFNGPSACGRRRRRHPEIADQAQQIGALQAERARGVRAVASRLVQRGLDEAPLEVGHGAVIAGRRLRGPRVGHGTHGGGEDATRVPRPARAKIRSRTRAGGGECPARWAACPKTKGPRDGEGPRHTSAATNQDFVAGFTPGWSLKNCLFSSI